MFRLQVLAFGSLRSFARPGRVGDPSPHGRWSSKAHAYAILAWTSRYSALITV
jgi:hypothetical protein